jgi:radical SAM superfamily enzyme YgiQ (UPF0313 family)
MKVLLVNPPIYDFSAYDVWLKPLGLLYLSNILKSYSFEVILLDCLDRNFFPHIKPKQDCSGKFPHVEVKKPEIIKNIPLKYKRYGISQNDIINFLSVHKDTDYVIITCSITYWYLGVEEVIDLIRAVIPNTRILLGGIYPILSPQHASRRFFNKTTKIFYTSDFSELLDYLCIPHKYQYKDFVNFPYPDFSHYKKVYYVTTRFSYGCRYNCAYCGMKSIHPKYKSKNIEQFINEIKILYETTSCQNIVFYDDELLDSIDITTTIELFSKLIKLNLPLKFYTPNGINPKFITKEIANLMYHLNFTDLRLSLETISDKVHNIVDKKLLLRDFEYALDNLFSSGFKPTQISVYILLGLPTETIEDVYKTIEYISKYKIRIRLCELAAVPNAKMFRYLTDNVDPLLHNNTIFIFNGIPGIIEPLYKFEELQLLKKYVNQTNKLYLTDCYV